ncbi:MAG: hypothetical protein K2O32_16435 [Acetatifactor sp.]|nr:hypothetical protein [Acetatifactor sp.]
MAHRKFSKDRNVLRALFFLLIGLTAAPCVTLQAEEGEDAPTKIETYEDLLQIGKDPQGSYVLMNDIDMSGLPWEPVAFEGVFDGGGHTLLNLSVENVGAEQADTYDGNYKVYETYFAGLFSTLKEAEIRNVNLVNLQMELETDVPCFIGGIAGYSENSTVRNCNIQGRLELRAHDRMFGVGGIVGYGNGLIEQTGADVTLICIDTDADTRDEQFMGGAYAAGYLDLNECNIVIDGYDSDHGYVHNGGLVGMYIFYPKGTSHEGRITNNTVQGRIRFFEDNTDRRAYCREYLGEVMSWNLKNSDNSAVFERDEVFDYTIDLRPDMCVDASHTETVTEPGCNTFGYTTITCGGCGYAYTDFYTLYRHSVEEWTTIQSPTQFNTGVQSGVCVRCGVVLEEEMPMLEYEEPSTPAETPTLTEAEQTRAFSEEDSSVAETKNDIPFFLHKPIVITVAVVLILLFSLSVFLRSRMAKSLFEKARKH